MLCRSVLVTPGVLLLGLTLVAASQKKEAASGGGSAPGPGDPAAVVQSDYLLFAQLNAKAVRESAAFTEFKRAFAKAGGAAEWDQAESGLGREIGVKPTDVDTVTVCVTEAPEREGPKFVVIVAANKPVQKGGVFGLKPGAQPDARGFHAPNPELLVHFPDDKTMVLLHPSLAQKYLDGFAKNRAGWPLTAELSKAVSEHTLFVAVRPDKLPADARDDRELRMFGPAFAIRPLFAARAAVLKVDLKGKELSVAARATFADATAAGKARHKVHALIGLASDGIDEILDKAGADLGILRPAVKEAERALATAKVEVNGSDLTASAAYKADFDFGAVVAEAVVKIREAAKRMKASNNFKQIGLSLIIYADANGGALPVPGVGAKGVPLKNANEKPLLSWRVAILPYIEQDALYRQFKLDEPWDSENNKKLIDKMPNVFAPVGRPGKAGHTYTQMVVGPNALRANMRYPASFPDGTSNTIAVVEAAEPVIWTKPDDVMLPGKELPKGLKKKFGGEFRGGFHVAMWDGSVRFVSDTISEKTLGRAINPADGEVLGDDW